MKKYMMGLAAAMMAMSESYAHPEKVFAEEKRKEPKAPSTQNTMSMKAWKEQLEAKGLKEFEINGEVYIAHNEREANKRYNHRHKNSKSNM